MSKSYTPGLKIVENTQVSKNRLLPLSGKVHVNKNEQIKLILTKSKQKVPSKKHK